MPKVSVIVPTYDNVEFLPQCLDSILAQTMPDFELIVIDDGSTDGSAVVAEDYAAQDVRVRVIHQANGGRSNARNNGIALANGENIAFVDADDWVEPSYLEYFFQIREGTGCQLVACNHVIEVDGKTYPRFPEQTAMERLPLRSAMENVLYHRPPDISSCCKLYPAELLRSIRYPEGKVFEDTATIADALMAAGDIGMGFAPQYHYRYRASTISKTVELNQLWDFMDAVEHLTQRALAVDPSLERACVRRRVHGALSTKRLNVRDHPKPDYARANRVIREGALTVLRDRNAPRRDKLGIIASLLGDKAFHALWQVYSRNRNTY